MSFLHHRVKFVKAQAAVRKAAQKEERARECAVVAGKARRNARENW